VAETLLTRRSALHQNEIVGAIPQTSYWLQQQLSNLSHFLSRHFGSANGFLAGQAQIYQEVLKQARLLAFVDVFRWIALLCFGCVALVWLFKKVQPGRRAPAGAH
jgi:DHA2 family multidrug resistance protein